jgi:probable HAF family extracellular repeat protein
MAIPLHHRLLLLAAVLTAPFPAGAITTTGQYTVTILGRVQHNYPESAFNALSINDNGVVAGSATVRVPNNRSLATRGVLWQSSTPHCTILGTISENPNGFDSQATWINNSGIAVGSSGGDPAIFTPNGVVDLGNPYAGFQGSGSATCINNYGQVVGTFYFNDGANVSQAFLYQNGVMTALGRSTSVATAINDSGLIVGSIYNEDPHAAYYANGAWVDMAFLGLCTSVNASGTIVGTWHNYYVPGSGCFIYQNGQMTYLNAPQRSGNPFINNAGQIVVGNFIYQHGVWQDINDLDLGDGWTFSQATGINNQGAIIGTVSRVVNGTILIALPY